MEQALQNCPLDPNTFLQWPKPNHFLLLQKCGKSHFQTQNIYYVIILQSSLLLSQRNLFLKSRFVKKEYVAYCWFIQMVLEMKHNLFSLMTHNMSPSVRSRHVEYKWTIINLTTHTVYSFSKVGKVFAIQMYVLFNNSSFVKRAKTPKVLE